MGFTYCFDNVERVWTHGVKTVVQSEPKSVVIFNLQKYTNSQ